MREKIGYSFLHPDRTLDWRIVDTVAAAQSNAAFASERECSGIELPKDWDRAYERGFRIVPVTMTIRPGHRVGLKAFSVTKS